MAEKRIDIILPSGEVGSIALSDFDPKSTTYRVAEAREVDDYLQQKKYGNLGSELLGLGSRALSGATAGLSDVAIANLGGRDFLRFAHEDLGLGGSLAEIGGGAAALYASAARGPASLLTRAATAPARAVNALGATAERFAGGGLAGLTMRGGVEGGLYGLGQAAAESQIYDTPLTGEKLVSAFFGGALLGGGISGGLGLAGKAFKGLASKVLGRELSKAERSVSKLRDTVPDAQFTEIEPRLPAPDEMPRLGGEYPQLPPGPMDRPPGEVAWHGDKPWRNMSASDVEIAPTPKDWQGRVNRYGLPVFHEGELDELVGHMAGRDDVATVAAGKGAARHIDEAPFKPPPVEEPPLTTGQVEAQQQAAEDVFKAAQQKQPDWEFKKPEVKKPEVVEGILEDAVPEEFTVKPEPAPVPKSYKPKSESSDFLGGGLFGRAVRGAARHGGRYVLGGIPGFVVGAAADLAMNLFQKSVGAQNIVQGVKNAARKVTNSINSDTISLFAHPISAAVAGSQMHDHYKSQVERLKMMRQNPEIMKAHLIESMAEMGGVAPKVRDVAVETAMRAHAVLEASLPVNGLSIEQVMNDPTSVSKTAMQQFLTLSEVIANPRDIMKNVKQGKVGRPEMEKFQHVYPNMYDEILGNTVKEFLDLQARGKTIPYNEKLSVSRAFGLEFDPTMNMGFIQSVQATYASQPKPQQKGTPAKSKVAEQYSLENKNGTSP